MNIFGNSWVNGGLALIGMVGLLYLASWLGKKSKDWKFLKHPVVNKVATVSKALVDRALFGEVKESETGLVTTEVKEEPIRCKVWDNTTRRVCVTLLPYATVKGVFNEYKTLGRLWMLEGVYTMELNRDSETHFRPMFMPTTLEYQPTELFRILHQPQIALTYSVTPPKGMLEKLMPVLIFAGCIILGGWMFTSSLK